MSTFCYRNECDNDFRLRSKIVGKAEISVSLEVIVALLGLIAGLISLIVVFVDRGSAKANRDTASIEHENANINLNTANIAYKTASIEYEKSIMVHNEFKNEEKQKQSVEKREQSKNSNDQGSGIKELFIIVFIVSMLVFIISLSSQDNLVVGSTAYINVPVEMNARERAVLYKYATTIESGLDVPERFSPGLGKYYSGLQVKLIETGIPDRVYEREKEYSWSLIEIQHGAHNITGFIETKFLSGKRPVNNASIRNTLKSPVKLYEQPNVVDGSEIMLDAGQSFELIAVFSSYAEINKIHFAQNDWWYIRATVQGKSKEGFIKGFDIPRGDYLILKNLIDWNQVKF